MNWPAPTLDPPAFPSPLADVAAEPTLPTPERPETPQQRRLLSAVPAAAWVAVLGGSLVLVAAAVFVAAGSDLGAVPTWSWLAAGGLALVVVAVLIERGGQPGAADLRQLVSRWD